MSDATNISICEQRTHPPARLNGPSPKIGVRQSPVHGFGVFAREFIAEGELIEEARLIRLGYRSKYLNDPVSRDYVWMNTACSCPECVKHGHVQFIALGFCSLYNHHESPNTVQQLDFSSGVMRLSARRDIEANAELFVNYGRAYWVLRKFWGHLSHETIGKIIEMENKNL